MMKKFFLNLLVALTALALCLAGLELFLRRTHFLGARVSWAIADPELGWRMAPGRYWYVHENNHPVEFRINRYGWRGPDWPAEKPAGTLRVALLGDSYVEALQVEEDSAFPTLAAQKLAAVGQTAEFLNFGRSCNTQSEELLILQKDVLHFRPDVVVLFYFAVNDIGDLNPSTSLTLMRPFYREAPQAGGLELDTQFNRSREFLVKKLINPLKLHSALISLLTERFIILQRVRQAKNIGLLGDDPDAQKSLKAYLSLATESPDPQYLKNYRLSKRLIAEMQAVCRQHGIRFVLVNIDLPWYVPEVAQKFKSADPTFSADFFDRDLKAFARSQGIPFVGLQAPFEQRFRQEGQPLHFKYWDTLGTQGYWEYGAHTGHWNALGHETVAEVLSRSLLDLRENLPA